MILTKEIYLLQKLSKSLKR